MPQQQINLGSVNSSSLLTNGSVQLPYRTGFRKIGDNEIVTVKGQGMGEGCNCIVRKVGTGKVEIERTYDD